MSSNDAVCVTIDGAPYDVPGGLPLLAALDAVGVRPDDVNIPCYCWHPKLSIDGSCRMCQVEVVGEPGLQIACNTPARDGLVVRTRGERVAEARRGVMEFLLLDHPLDCPICDQAGECGLQDRAVQYGRAHARTREPRRPAAKAVPVGREIVLDQERCILCRRCVRFCREVTGSAELGVFERGDASVIDVFPGRPLDNPYSMNTADLCPVGALTTRDFRFKIRAWALRDAPSLCTGCATGCNVWASHAHGKVYRYKPRRNDVINGTWMCDAGRSTYRANSRDRLTTPGADGLAASAKAAVARAADLLRKSGDPSREVFALASAAAPNEDLAALAEFARALGAEAPQYQLETGSGDELLLHAEKAPNAAGARALGLEPFAALPPSTRIVIALGPGIRLPAESSAHVVLVDAHLGRVAERAACALPLCSHLEREGTFRSASGVEQTFDPVIAPPDTARTGVVWLREIAAVAGLEADL